MVARAELTGQRFGRLTVVRYADSTKRGKARWLCCCDCGGTASVLTTNLLRGSTQSCGCLQREAASKSNSSHGLSRCPEYKIWLSIRQRCSNPRNPNFPAYGGRGVRVCSRWDDFEAFLADMGPRPSYAHSLDRFPNQTGNYEPENCRWATAKEQGRNKTNNHLVTHNGQTKPLCQWCEELGLDYLRTRMRLGKGWTPERAFSQPPRLTRVTRR